jgi:hypothetical protein
MSSCDYRNKTSDNPVTFDTVQVDKSYYFNDDQTRPGCNFRIRFIYPDSYASTDTLSLNRIQLVFTEKTLGSVFKGKEPEEALNEFITLYLNDFNQFVSSIKNDNEENESLYEDETGYSYYVHLKNSVLYNKNGLISFVVETVSFEGGAHNSKSIYGYVYDLNKKDFLKEEDFSENNYNKNVSLLLAEKIAEQNGVRNPTELEHIGFNHIEDIKPNNNFTLDDNGITYYFNENEIAGTMIGLVQIHIPYDELDLYLQQNSVISPLIAH